MKIFMDPTFWTSVAFLLCIFCFGYRVFSLVSNNLNARIQAIEDQLKEAQILDEKAQKIFYQGTKDARDVDIHILEIKEKTEKEIKFLWEEAHKRLQEMHKNKEAQFLKRIKILEDQTRLRLKDEFSNHIYKVLGEILKEISSESQKAFMKKSISQCSTQLLRS